MKRVLAATSLIMLLIASSANGDESICGVWDYEGFKNRVTERLHITEDNKVIRECLIPIEENGESKLTVITSEGSWKVNPKKSRRTTYLIEFDSEEIYIASFRSAAYPKDLVTSRKDGWGGHRYQSNRKKPKLKNLLPEWKTDQRRDFEYNQRQRNKN